MGCELGQKQSSNAAGSTLMAEPPAAATAASQLVIPEPKKNQQNRAKSKFLVDVIPETKYSDHAVFAGRRCSLSQKLQMGFLISKVANECRLSRFTTIANEFESKSCLSKSVVHLLSYFFVTVIYNLFQVN